MSLPQSISSAVNGSARWALAVNSSGLYVASTYFEDGDPFDPQSAPYYTKSSDGINWSAMSLMSGFIGAFAPAGMAVNSSGKFVMMGNYTLANLFMASTSTDATTWTTPTAYGDIDHSYSSIAVNSSGLFVAAGSRYDGLVTIQKSTTGTTWTSSTIAGIDSLPTAIAVSPAGRFVIVGNYISGTLNSPCNFTTSADGTTWTTVAQLAPNYYQVYGIASNASGFFVAVGAYTGGFGSFPLPAIVTSSNGITWNAPVTLTRASGVETCRFTSVAVNSTGRFVAIGFGLLTGGGTAIMYATSTNGTTWSAVSPVKSTMAFAQMYQIAVGPSKVFAAVGINSAGGGVFQPISSYGIWP